MKTQTMWVLVVLICGVLPAFATPPSSLPTGLLPPTEEDRAWAKERGRVLPPPPEKVVEALPRRHINLEHLPPVRQQTIGSCASWSVVYYVKGWQEAKEHGITRPFPEEHILSPAFVFQWVGISAQSGSTFESNFRFLESHGTVTFEEFKEDYGLMGRPLPPVELWKAAAARRSATDSLGLIPTNTQEGLDTLKAHLVSGELASAAVSVYRNFDEYPRSAPGVDNSVFYAEGTTGFRDYHAVTIIGYDDDITYHNGTEERQGAFLAVNSWGTGWGARAEEGGERGYVWLAYEYYLNDMGAPERFDFYTMENRVGYKPRHFVTLDMYHPLRGLIFLGLLTHQREGDNLGARLMPPSAGLRPMDGRIATDVTDHVTDKDEAVWIQVSDNFLPGDDRPHALIRGVKMEHEGRPPLVAREKVPLEPANQLGTGARPEQIPLSPTYRHDMVIPRDGLLISEGAIRVSADIADIFGEGRIDIAAMGQLLRMEDGRPVGVGDIPPGEIALGDYDNDGLPDLAVWGRFDDLSRIRLYRNQGDGRFVEETVFPLMSGVSIGSLHWVDFNGNGRLDLVAMRGRDSQLFLNLGSGVFRASELTLPRAPTYVNKIVDFDQDGRMDFGGWRNLGNGEWAPPPWRENAPIAWGDYNGNGLLDAAILERSSTISLYRNDGDGEFTRIIRDVPTCYWHMAPMRWADVNNSGRLDLMVMGNLRSGPPSFYITTDARTRVYTQQEDGSLYSTGLAIHAHGSLSTLVVADFDQDGDVDFLTGGYPSIEGESSFSTSVPREVRYTESLWAEAEGRALPNEPPAAPTNLRAEMPEEAGAVTLRWDDAADDRTPPRAMRYQLRVGTTSGGHEVVSAAHSLAEIPQRRLSPEQAGTRLQDLAGTTHYWSVRAVDASGAFSPWAPEQAFHVERGVRATPPFDPNQDGVLDSGDVATILTLIGSTNPGHLARADLDGTGRITSNDALEMARMLARPGTGPTPPWMAVVDHMGATLELDDAVVTIPPGAIEGEPAILRLGKQTSAVQFERNVYHTPYRLSGIPYDLKKPIEVTLRNSRWSQEGWQEPLLAIGEEGFTISQGNTNIHYTIVDPDKYENNLIHFSIDPLPEDARKALKEDFVEGTYSRDFFALGGHSRYTTPHFSLVFPMSFDTEIVENLANDLEQAHSRFSQPDMGFSYAARTRWPVSVTLKDMGDAIYGQAYASVRGPNHGGLEFNTRHLDDPVTRRATAFHEFFHIVETFYDPRNRFSVAKFMAPHYTLSEMVATWIEELSVANPEEYVPAEWETNNFAPFDDGGWDLPPSITGSNRHSGTVAAHGYGLSGVIRYLVQRNDIGIVRRIYESLQGGQNWINAVGAADGGPSYHWFHDFMVSYALGEVYPVDDGVLVAAAAGAGQSLRLDRTRTAATYDVTMPNLSAGLYSVQVHSGAPSNLITPESRIGFRLEGPTNSRLSILSMVVRESRELVDYVPWDDGVSRYLADCAYSLLTQPQSAYFALVTHDKYFPRHADPEEFELSIVLVEDQTVDLLPEVWDVTWPTIDFKGGTVFVPASSGMEVTILDIPGHTVFPTQRLRGFAWEDEESNFAVSLPDTFLETREELPDGRIRELSDVRFDLHLVKPSDDPDEEEEVVEVHSFEDGNFEFLPHEFEGKIQWWVELHFTVKTTYPNDTVMTNDIWFPIMNFVADVL